MSVTKRLQIILILYYCFISYIITKDEALSEDHHLDAGDDKEQVKVEESEFVSDAFIPTNVQDPDLTSAMQQLSTNSATAAGFNNAYYLLSHDYT